MEPHAGVCCRGGNAFRAFRRLEGLQPAGAGHPGCPYRAAPSARRHPVAQQCSRPIKKRIDAIQLDLFGTDSEAAWLPGTVVLAYLASPEEGLSEVFLGVLQKSSFTAQYAWRDVAPVYQRDEVRDLETADMAPSVSIKHADEEPEADPKVNVDPTKRQQPPMKVVDGEDDK